MDKSFLLTVGITCILMGMVYLFMKQKLAVYDDKISSLFSVVQTMADELQTIKLKSPSEVAKPLIVPTTISVSDDSQSEDDSDSDAESNTDFDNETTKIVVLKTEPEEDKMENLNFINIVNRFEDVYSMTAFCAVEMSPCAKDAVEYSMDDALEDTVTIVVHDAVDEIGVNDVTEVDVLPPSTNESATKAYSSMTVKELKKLVTDKGGPYLKTKQDLILYLENTTSKVVKE